MGANSTLIRNALEDLLGEDFEGRFESEYLARAIVESLLDPSQVRIGDAAEIDLSWQYWRVNPLAFSLLLRCHAQSPVDCELWTIQEC